MITKQQFIDAVLEEIRIIKHLFGKIPVGKFDYKPTEKQRTTLELLRYLSVMGGLAVRGIRAGDSKIIMQEHGKPNTLNPEEFLAAMDKQAAEIKATISAMTDAELNEAIDLWNDGTKEARSLALLRLVLEAYVMYKMQLFLYIKASGNTAIGTSNLWSGEDGGY